MSITRRRLFGLVAALGALAAVPIPTATVRSTPAAPAPAPASAMVSDGSVGVSQQHLLPTIPIGAIIKTGATAGYEHQYGAYLPPGTMVLWAGMGDPPNGWQRAPEFDSHYLAHSYGHTFTEPELTLMVDANRELGRENLDMVPIGVSAVNHVHRVSELAEAHAHDESPTDHIVGLLDRDARAGGQG